MHLETLTHFACEKVTPFYCEFGFITYRNNKMREYVQYIRYTACKFAPFHLFQPYVNSVSTDFCLFANLSLSQPGYDVWDSTFILTLKQHILLT